MNIAHSGSARIAWEERGSGEPLLLVMGHRFSRQMWFWAADSLAARRRVILFDNRGTGESNSPAGPYTIRDLADDAFAVLDAAGIVSADIYGVSMGGMIAQEMALSRPERVRSLVLGCTAAMSPERKRPSRASYWQYWVPSAIMARLVRSLLYGPDADPGRVAQDLAAIRKDRSDPRGLVRQAQAIAAYNNLESISSLKHRALVLHGSEDRVIPIGWGEELARALPNAKLVVLEGAGHAFLADAGERANKETLAFLEGN